MPDYYNFVFIGRIQSQSINVKKKKKVVLALLVFRVPTDKGSFIDSLIVPSLICIQHKKKMC